MRRIAILLSMVVVLCASFSLAYSRAVDLASWFDWWRDGASPIGSEGKVVDFHELILKEKGSQKLTFLTPDGRRITVTTFLRKSQVDRVVSIGDFCDFSYYPYSSGDIFATSVSCGEKQKYSHLLVDSGWPGFFSLILLIFYVLAMSGFSYLTFLVYKGRFLDASDK